MIPSYERATRTLRLMRLFFIMCFLVFVATALFVIPVIMVNGPIYKRISAGENLIADILPPPGFISELHLYASNLAYAKPDGQGKSVHADIESLMNRYNAAVAKWRDSSAEVRQHFAASDRCVQEYFRVLASDFVPAVDSASPKRSVIFETGLEPLYQYHKAEILKITAIQQKLNREQERRAAIIVFSAAAALAAIAVVLFAVMLTTWKVLGARLSLYFRELRRGLLEKERFITILSHDLRGPLSSVHHMLSEINAERGIPDELKKEALTESEKAVERIYSLLENLLEWSATHTDEIKPRKEKNMLFDIVAEGVSVLETAAKNKNITIEVTGENSEVETDLYMLATVIRNITSNSIKFTQRGGKITISAHRENAILHLRIADNGVGMDSEKIRKLFKLDERIASAGTGGERGGGFGLKLCNELIRMNGGSITVSSRPGEWTEVNIELRL